MSVSTSFDFAPLLPRRIASAGGEMDGACEIQFCRRQQRSRPGAGRRADRCGQCGAEARGQDLATYGLASGPQGYRPLREFLCAQAEARRRHRCDSRRHHDRLRLAAGARPRQPDLARARRHRDRGAGNLSGLAESPDPARRQHHRHPPRRRRHADGRARQDPRRSQDQGHPSEIHLHHPDGAEPDRHHHAGIAARRAVEAVAGIRRADLRGRLLCRPDLGRQASARDLRHGQKWRRDPYRLVLEVDRARAARRLHRRALGRCCRGCWR